MSSALGGLEALTRVYLPNSINHTPGFYVSLARAKPTLKFITFGEDDTEGLDDACVAAVCENLALERLMIDDNSTLTPRFVDIILASQTAQTLSDVSLSAYESSRRGASPARDCVTVRFAHRSASFMSRL